MHQTTAEITRALRERAGALADHHDVCALIKAADELDRLSECSSEAPDSHDDSGLVLREIRELNESFRHYRLREGERRVTLQTTINHLQNEVGQLKEMTMSIVKEVQDLLDAVALQGVAITDASASLVSLEGNIVSLDATVADLAAKLAAAQAGGPAVDADDLAAIVAATGTVVASVATLKAAMPVPVPAPVVAAVA